jgi:diguanylate cyclase (GGDEF)-like protein/PAS domain S-box-containing protein
VDLAPGATAEHESQRAETARLVSRIRWAGVALGALEAFMTSDPRPVAGWIGLLAGAVFMAAYNVPVALAQRLPPRLLEPAILFALCGDFLVVASWTVLTANDPYSTSYAAFGLVAIEAAVLYRWRGSVGFMLGFTATYGFFYWLRWELFGFPPLVSSILYRTGIVLTGSAFAGLITVHSERRRLRYESLLRAVSDFGEGLLITEGGRTIYANQAYRDLTEYSDAELRELTSLLDLAPDDQRDALRARFGRRLLSGALPTQYESQLVTKSGRIRDVDTVVRPLTAERGSRMIALVRDISERKQAQALLEESERKAQIAAHLDALTGIANRRAWDEELDAAMGQARVNGRPLTVALLDLDAFKAYNDDWGHQRGDDLLRSFTARWRDPLREGDLLARYGGDEFAVLLRGSNVDEARLVIERLRAATAALQSFSVGLANWDGVESAESLMSRADAALYNSKRVGPGRVTVLATSHERVQSWSYLIPRIIAGRDMDAIYQSIHRLDDLSIAGYEALARPAGFGLRSSVEDLFDAAKRLGFTRDLDWLCRRAAVHGATILPQERMLFINVSIHALLDPLHDVDQMLLLMRWAGRDPSTVVFEISERDVISDLDRLLGVVAAYRAEGFRFALDDVGEGHSTIEVLTCANPEYIKIARSLSVGVDSPGPRSAVQAMVTFARSSGAAIIAEGLETDTHVRMIRDLGIALGQGYVFGSPRTGEQLTEGAAAATTELRGAAASA